MSPFVEPLSTFPSLPSNGKIASDFLEPDCEGATSFSNKVFFSDSSLFSVKA